MKSRIIHIIFLISITFQPLLQAQDEGAKKSSLFSRIIELGARYLADNAPQIEKSPDVTFGPLKLSNITLSVSPRGLDLTAEGSVFGYYVAITSKEFIGTDGKPITGENVKKLLELKTLNLQTMVLEAAFKETLSFSVFGKPVGLRSVQLALDKDQPVKISANYNLFDQVVEFIFQAKSNNKMDLITTLKNPVTLASMLPFDIGSVGNVAFRDIQLSLTDVFDLSTPLQNIRASSIKATTSLRTDQTVYPFANTGVGVLSSIGFKNFSFEIESKDNAFDLQFLGTVILFGHDLSGSLTFIKKPDVATPIGLLEVDASAYAHIGQVIPAFKGTIFDNITLKKMRFLATSRDVTLQGEDGKPVEFKAGLTLEAITQLSGALAPLAQLSNQPESVEVKLSTIIKANPLESAFRIELPFSIPVQGNNLSMSNVTAEIGGLPKPQVALKTTVFFKVPGQVEPLSFTSSIGFGISGAILAGTLKGTWQNALGLQGFNLSNVVLQIGFAPGTIVSSVGLAASMAIGSSNLAFATNIALTQPDDFVFTASVERLSVGDFVGFIGSVIKKRIDTSAIPTISFEKVRVYLAPKDTKIGELEFKQGFGGALSMKVVDFKAFVEFSYMKDEGIVFEGYASKFNLGELVITGAGPDRNYNTPDDGPYSKLELTKSNQAFFLSGMIVLDPVFKSQTEINFEGNALSFKFHTKLNNVFEIEAIGKGSLKEKEVYFMIDFKTDFIEFVQREVDKGLKEFQRIAERDLKAAQEKVRELNDRIAELDRQIAERNKGIEELKAIIARKTEEAKRKLVEARADLDNKKRALESEKQRVQADIERRQRAIDEDRNRDVNNLQREVNDLQRQWDSFSDLEKAFRWIDVGIPLGAKITALEIARSKLGDVATDFGKAVLQQVAPALANDLGFKTAQAGVDLAQKTLEGLEKIAFDPSSLIEAGEITKLGLEIGGLETGKAGAIASRESAVGVLEGMRHVAYYGIGEGGKLIVKNLLDIIRIKHIRAEASAQELIRGSLPKVTLDMVVLGQERSLKDMQFKFGDPRNPKEMPKAMEESAKSIGNAIIKFITG